MAKTKYVGEHSMRDGSGKLVVKTTTGGGYELVWPNPLYSDRDGRKVTCDEGALLIYLGRDVEGYEPVAEA